MTRRWLPTLVVCLAGCQQQMAQQPSYRPLEPSSLFADGSSARPLVPGTISRDAQFITWKQPLEIAGWQRAASLVGQAGGQSAGAATPTPAWSIYVDAFPKAVTLEMLEHGQERFSIYCAVCHDRVGTGHGMIVQRGFTPPPNFHTDLSRGFKLRGVDLKLTEAPVGYYFEVITAGFGAMPEYAHQVPADERWAIIAYIRALQFSQDASLKYVSNQAEKKKLLEHRGGQQ